MIYRYISLLEQHEIHFVLEPRRHSRYHLEHNYLAYFVQDCLHPLRERMHFSDKVLLGLWVVAK